MPSRDVPPAPELGAFVDVGLANISRVLEKMADSKGVSDRNLMEGMGRKEDPAYLAVFVARSGQPAAFNSHFPQMVAVASRSHPELDQVRLIGFSGACEDRLSHCLGIPRASSIAIRVGAPQSKPLVDFVRAHVPAVEVAWFQEAGTAQHRPTNIVTTETAVGAKRQRKS